MRAKTMTTLHEMLEHISKIDGVLLVVKNSSGAIAEIKSSCLRAGGTRQKSRWVTLGDNDGPAHMHIDAEQVCYAEFVEEVKTPVRTSFSIRFFDCNDIRVLAAFWTKMYDESGTVIASRMQSYTDVKRTYGTSRIVFEKTPEPSTV